MSPLMKHLKYLGGLVRQRSVLIAVMTLSVIFLSSVGVHYLSISRGRCGIISAGLRWRSEMTALGALLASGCASDMSFRPFQIAKPRNHHTASPLPDKAQNEEGGKGKASVTGGGVSTQTAREAARPPFLTQPFAFELEGGALRRPFLYTVSQ